MAPPQPFDPFVVQPPSGTLTRRMVLANGPKMRESRRQSSFNAPGGGNMASTDDGAYVEPAVAGLVAMLMASLVALTEGNFCSLTHKTFSDFRLGPN